MENIQSTLPDINEVVKIYADKKGLSEAGAWAQIRGSFIPKNEVLDIIGKQPQTQPQRLTDLVAQKNSKEGELAIEKLKLELEYRKFERQEKVDAEERAERKRKIELDEQKLALDREIQLRKLEGKEEYDRETLRIQAQAANKPNNGDLFEQMNTINKIEQTINDKNFSRMEALGIDVSALRKAAGSKTDGNSNSIWPEVIKSFLPLLEKLSNKLDPPQNAPSGFEMAPPTQQQYHQPPQQSSQMPETYNRAPQQPQKTEAQIRAEVQMETEQRTLKQDIAFEKKQAESRQELESKASELGLNFDSNLSDEQIFSMIQEAMTEKEAETYQDLLTPEELENRQRLINRAIDLGIPFDSTISNIHLSELIEKWEKDLEHINPAPTKSEIDVPVKKQKQVKVKTTTKDLKKFEIHDMEGVSIQDIDAKSHKSAALLMAKKLNGTKENPVRIRIKLPDEEIERIFETWMVERHGKKGQVFSPRIREIKDLEDIHTEG